MSETLQNLSLTWCEFHINILFMLLYRPRYDKQKTVILTGICIGAMILAGITLLILFGYEKTGQFSLLAYSLPGLLFFWLMSKDRDWRFFFTFCLTDTFSVWLIIVSGLLDYYLADDSGILLFVVRLVAFPFAEWITIRYLRKPYIELQKNVKSGWMTATAIGAVYYLLLLVMISYPTVITNRSENTPVMVLILILMPLTYAAIIYALHQQLLMFRTMEKDKLLNMQKELLEIRLADYDATGRLRHDIQASQTILAGLMENLKYKEARLMISEMNEQIEKTYTNYCNDAYVNAVLSQYAGKFEKKEVPLKISLQLASPEMPGQELSLILSSALDNSLRAVLELPKQKRKASVQLRQKETYLLLRIRNSCDPNLTVKQGDIPPSTKTDPGHGYGLLTIQETAEALGGSAVCYTTGEEFVLDVNIKNVSS